MINRRNVRWPHRLNTIDWGDSIAAEGWGRYVIDGHEYPILIFVVMKKREFENKEKRAEILWKAAEEAAERVEIWTKKQHND